MQNPSTNLNRKIAVYKQTGNSLLTDKPAYERLFDCFASITQSSSCGFSSAMGTDVITTDLNITVRKNSLWQKINPDNNVVVFQNRHFKIASLPLENERGYLSFTARLLANEN